MSRLFAVGRRTFSALSVSNYRRFFFGQSVSLVGTWMQTVAQSWLVYTLTHSATALGFVVALQTLPVLVLGAYGGVIADRVDKRRLMIVLQSLMGLQALVLGLLAVTHVVRFWELCVLAVVLGLNNTFENPARQSFVLEMVGPAELRNAVSLNSTMVNVARAVGPAIAGLLIAGVGEGACFLINALSFGAVVYSLASMDTAALSPTEPTGRAKGQLREGFRYVKGEPRTRRPPPHDGDRRDARLRVPGDPAGGRQADLPRGLRDLRLPHGRHGHRCGARWSRDGGPGPHRAPALHTGGAAFGIAIGLAALAPVLGAELVALGAVGWASVTFIATGNTTLQLQAEPTMRGRVMSLWAVAFMGTTPVGGPLIGWVIAMAAPRVGLGVGAVACVVAAGMGLIAMAKLGLLHGPGRGGHEAGDREGPVAGAPFGLLVDPD